jgi:Neuraminidase (sialidase)
MQDGKTLICCGSPKGTLGADFPAGSLWVYVSENGGYTWKLKSGFSRAGFYSACEPHIIELRDGTLLVAIRFEKQDGTLQMAIARSTDGGKNWKMEQIKSVVGAPGHLLEMPNGVVVLVYGYRENPTGTRARYSTDGGKTWGREVVLCVSAASPEIDLGYPSSVLLDDGTILTAYYQPANKTDGYPSFLFTRWTLTEAAS